jgi:hypothetical protein
MAEANVTSNQITDRAMRIKTLAKSIKLFLDSDEHGAGGSANAHAFELAGMISAEAEGILKGGAA